MSFLLIDGDLLGFCFCVFVCEGIVDVWLIASAYASLLIFETLSFSDLSTCNDDRFGTWLHQNILK